MKTIRSAAELVVGSLFVAFLIVGLPWLTAILAVLWETR